MANIIICNELTGDIDLSCKRVFPKSWYQEAVFINFNDIDRTASQLSTNNGTNCAHSVQMVLKPGKKGTRLRLPDGGSTIKGFYDKSTTDNGDVEYLHKAQGLIKGADEETMCIIDKLDHGLYVIALQTKADTVFIYGWENGLSTGDYTWDITAGGGGTVLPFQNKEAEKESMLPLVYKPQTGGDANADFNSQFEQP